MSEGERRRTRVGAYALATDDAGRILLCRTAPHVLPKPLWMLPGGGLHFGEAPEAAVVRELEEEAGLDGEVVRLVDVSDRTWPPSVDGVLPHARRNCRLEANPERSATRSMSSRVSLSNCCASATRSRFT